MKSQTTGGKPRNARNGSLECQNFSCLSCLSWLIVFSQHMKILDARKSDFWKELARIPRGQGTDPKVQSVVAGIISAVHKRGDAALVQLNNKFSRVNIPANKLRIDKAQIAAAAKSV